MQDYKAKHSKIRNTGLLYEFLLRQITADVLEKEKNSKAVFILKKRFSENTELGKELALYNIVINKKFDSDKQADYFISEVLNERNKLNNSILKREKYNLIKSLKDSLTIVTDTLLSFLLRTSAVICLNRNSNKRPVLRNLECFTLRITISPFV